MLAKGLMCIFILVAVHEVLGAAATIAIGLLMLIIAHARLLVWEATRRNNIERAEFQRVNIGDKEPDPHFLERVWNS